MGLIGDYKNRKEVEKELARIKAEEEATLKLIDEIEDKSTGEVSEGIGTSIFKEWLPWFQFYKYKSKINGK